MGLRALWRPFALILLLTSSPASAQEPDPPADDDGSDEGPGAEEPGDPAPPSGLVPPALETFADAELPPDTLEPGQSVAVTLLIVVTTDGTVSEASIAEGAGEPFDAAAIEAGRRLLFRPATRDGQPIAARIRFRYTFEGPEPPPEVSGIRGRVRDLDDAGIAGAQINLTALDPDAPGPVEADTDREGAFSLVDLPPGRYIVRVTAAGYQPHESTETLAARAELELNLQLEAEEPEEGPDAADDEAEDPPVLGVTAEVERPRREVTRRTISSDFLTQMPGTRGDALRVVELLPGVARPSFGSGALYIRGAAPQDSEVFVNGASVPLLYHFGGLTSFYNSRLLQRIDFYPSNFSVRFGRRIGGILEVEPRDPTSDDFHGIVDINLIDASLLLEARIGDNASIALAARRSYVDFWIAEVLPEDSLSLVAAPVYYDYQLIFNWRPEPEDRIQVLVYGSSDEFASQLGGSDEGERPFGLNLSTQFHRGQVSWRHRYDEQLRHDIMFAAGWTGLVIQAGDAFGFDAEFVPLTLRGEWNLRLHEQVELRWGLDWQWIPTQLAFRGVGTPTQSEGMPSMDDPNAPSTSANASDAAYRPAVYLETSLRPVEELQLVIGLRVDYFRDIDTWTFDPRVTARLSLSPQWAVKVGVGLFSQPPEFQESAAGLGNPDLQPITAVHASGGVELNLDRTWRFSIEGYYKHLFDRVVGTDGGLPPFFTNGGTGRIYGGELSMRAEPTPGYPIAGLLSYTLSRSERLDPDGEWRLFDYDQTHIFSLSLIWRIGDGWEAGASFRLVSGNPYTPVVGSIYDVRTDLYRPVYGAVNSERNDFFTRLDVRLEKVFVIDIVRLAIYIDVQNVYNAENRELTTYNFDYSQSAGINGLPILPSLGLRGEL